MAPPLKALYVLPEDPGSSSNTQKVATWSITPVPWDPKPAYNRCRHQAYSWYTYTHESKILTHIKF